MEQIDTLLTARWIIPIEPGARVLEEHAVAIDRGRIVAVLPARLAAARYAPLETLDRPSHVLLPGFVNAHTHAATALLRGAAESGSFEHWLNRQLRPLEQRWMDAEYVRDGSELAILDMLTSGTTCFADMDLFPEVVADAAAGLKMRASIGLPVLDAPTLWAGSASECLDKGLALHDEYRDDPLITTTLSPYAPWAVGDETLGRIQRAADELELPVTMHVNETRMQAHAAGERTLGRLRRLGLLSPLLTAVHMVHLDAVEMEHYAQGGGSIAHCPQSNLKLGNGVCPVPLLLAQGINVALGTDGAASNNDLSMLDEVRSAALLARGLFPEARPITAHEWLRIATLNGAQALGLGETIGSLAPGKWADLCCIDLDRPHTQPVYDVAAQLVYAASREQVTDVWVAGRALLRERQLTQVDPADVLSRAERWRERIGAGLRTLESRANDESMT